MRQQCAGFLLAHQAGVQRVGIGCAANHHARPQCGQPGKFGRAGDVGNKHFARHAEFTGCRRRGNARVAARCHDHAAGRNRLGQQAVEHAARLEAAAGLKVLQLEPDFGAVHTQRPAGQLPQRSFMNKVAVAPVERALTALYFIAINHHRRSAQLVQLTATEFQLLALCVQFEPLGQWKLDGFLHPVHLAD